MKRIVKTADISSPKQTFSFDLVWQGEFLRYNVTADNYEAAQQHVKQDIQSGSPMA